MSIQAAREVLREILVKSLLSEAQREFRTAEVQAKSTFEETEAAAWAALQAAVDAGATGWVQTTDKVHRITERLALKTLQDAGHLLDAEVAQGRVTTQIRHCGADWQITTLTESAGDTFWVQIIDRRAIDPDTPSNSGKITYHAYWRVDPLDGQQIEPEFTRFVELGRAKQ